jgi:hypothetical protein
MGDNNRKLMMNSAPFVKEMLQDNQMDLAAQDGNGKGRKNKQKQESVWGRIKLIMVETGLDTTAHGIPNILGNPMWSFKLMWLVCILASCAACAYLLARSVNDYLDHEVVTTIRRISDSPALFPTVTLCNANFITSQAAYDFVLQKINSDGQIAWSTAKGYDYIRY